MTQSVIDLTEVFTIIQEQEDLRKYGDRLYWCQLNLSKHHLRYPGGKSKAIKTLSQWYPKTISEYREPFIGGGSIAIDITKSNPDIPVWINDLYVPLYNFWVQLRDRGEELSERVREEKQNTLDERWPRIK